MEHEEARNCTWTSPRNMRASLKRSAPAQARQIYHNSDSGYLVVSYTALPAVSGSIFHISSFTLPPSCCCSSQTKLSLLTAQLTTRKCLLLLPSAPPRHIPYIPALLPHAKTSPIIHTTTSSCMSSRRSTTLDQQRAVPARLWPLRIHDCSTDHPQNHLHRFWHWLFPMLLPCIA
jgi:hypothetical protein